MKQFRFKINGNIYEVAVEETGKNLATVQVNGKTFSVETEKEETAKPSPAVPRPAAAAAPRPVAPKPAQGGANAVKAPIPGSIIRVEVGAGQAVKRGDLLLVMESMKMENNILAKSDGVVKAVRVQPGQTVLQGEVMIEME
ncbi:MAG: biotin/lipoyl-binding protein [Prevotellaceae bacterium]|jgi:biotin carboxyl carrier protein|nr:biotin/lipoyl-binding protein [Prevotellaceae bacterium]